MMGVPVLIAWIECHQLGPERAPASWHDAKKTFMLQYRKDGSQRLQDRAGRKIPQGIGHGGYQILHRQKPSNFIFIKNHWRALHRRYQCNTRQTCSICYSERIRGISNYSSLKKLEMSRSEPHWHIRST